MFCTNCGKEIDNNSVFCGYCGKKVLTSDAKVEKDTNWAERASSINQGMLKSKPKLSVNLIILVLAFILGCVLSFFTYIFMASGGAIAGLIWLAIMGIIWLVLGSIIFKVLFSITRSKGIGILCGIMGGFALMGLTMTLLSRYLEEIDGAHTDLQVFFLLLPLTVIYTIIIYKKASSFDIKRNQINNNITNANEQSNISSSDTEK